MSKKYGIDSSLTENESSFGLREEIFRLSKTKDPFWGERAGRIKKRKEKAVKH